MIFHNIQVPMFNFKVFYLFVHSWLCDVFDCEKLIVRFLYTYAVPNLCLFQSEDEEIHRRSETTVRGPSGALILEYSLQRLSGCVPTPRAVVVFYNVSSRSHLIVRKCTNWKSRRCLIEYITIPQRNTFHYERAQAEVVLWLIRPVISQNTFGPLVIFSDV